MLVENKEYLFDFELAFIFQSLCFSALPISKVSQSTFLLNKPELTRPYRDHPATDYYYYSKKAQFQKH